jgi:hypothetical protein
MTAKTKNPREILAQLMAMRNISGSNLYKRLKLTDQLLSDREWVEDPSGGGGDASKALDRIEEDCFGPEAGMSLPEMLEVLAAVPQESVWKQNRYNLKKMWLEMKERQDASRRMTTAPAPKSRTPASPIPSDNGKDYDQITSDLFLEGENKRLKEELKQAHAKIKEQDKEIHKLRRSLQRMKQVLEGLQIA